MLIWPIRLDRDFSLVVCFMFVLGVRILAHNLYVITVRLRIANAALAHISI